MPTHNSKITNVYFAIPVLMFILASCRDHSAPTTYFRVAVIVDITSDRVSEEQAAAVLAIANEQLIELTGFGLKLVDFVEDNSGGSIESIVIDYMQNNKDKLPNGILIFSEGDEDRAKINRAYAQHFLAPDGFRNSFVSPVLGNGYMYVAVVQFNHLYAACGYGGMDEIQSPVSIGVECGEQDGSPCASWEGIQVCQSALPYLEGKTVVDMAVGPVIHEFMHSFGDKGPGIHYTSEVCHEDMGWELGHYNLEEAEYYVDICPYVFDIFSNSYRP